MPTEYIVNPEVEEIANRVLPIVQKSWFDVPRIVYLVKVADKSRYLGKCSRATGKWAYLVNKDFVVEVFDGFWQEATQTQKEALLYHELLHITCEEDDEGEVKWGLKDHDTEEFVDVIKKYGAWNPVLEQIKTIMTAPPEIDKEVF